MTVFHGGFEWNNDGTGPVTNWNAESNPREYMQAELWRRYTGLEAGSGDPSEFGTVYLDGQTIYSSATGLPVTLLLGWNQGHGEATEPGDTATQTAAGWNTTRMLSRAGGDYNGPYESGDHVVSDGEDQGNPPSYLIADYTTDHLDVRVNDAYANGHFIVFVQDSNVSQGKLGDAAGIVGGLGDQNIFRVNGAARRAQILSRWTFLAARYKGKIAIHELFVEPFMLTETATTSTVTITIASPGVVTWTGHAFSNGQPVTFTTTGALPTGIQAGAVYFVVNQAANTFQIAAESGGTAINTSGSQSGVHTGTSMREVTQAEMNLFYVECADAVLAGNPGAVVMIGNTNAYDIDDAATMIDSTITTWMAAHPNQLVMTDNMLSGATVNLASYSKIIKLRDAANAAGVPWLVNQAGSRIADDGSEIWLMLCLSIIQQNGGHYTIWEYRGGPSATEYAPFSGDYGAQVEDAGRSANLAKIPGYIYATLETAAVAAATGAANTILIYIKEDLSNCYQDILGTTLCTAAGQFVGRVNAVVGGTNMAAAADTNRGILRRAPGGKGWYIEFDGVDDYYVHSSTFFASGDANQQVIVAANPGDTAGPQVLLHSGNATTNARNPYLAILSTGLSNAAWRGDDTTLRQVNGVVDMTDRACVMTIVKATNNKDQWFNGQPDGTQDTGAVGTLSAQNRTRIGASTTAGSFLDGSAGLWMMSKTMTTSSDRDAVARFGGAIMGGGYTT